MYTYVGLIYAVRHAVVVLISHGFVQFVAPSEKVIFLLAIYLVLDCKNRMEDADLTMDLKEIHDPVLSWYAQSNIIYEVQYIMGLLLDFLDSVLPGPREASPPIQQKYTAI
jgi:hypothetical protein